MHTPVNRSRRTGLRGLAAIVVAGALAACSAPEHDAATDAGAVTDAGVTAGGDSASLVGAELGGCSAPGTTAASPADTLDPRALSLAVNLPAYRLTVREGDSVVARYAVAVGMRRYPTPTGEFAVKSLEWNPWWVPPASDWAAGEPRTPPGPTNPLGPVKLEFAPLYLLHGTPAPASVGKAASHGCVRLRSEDAMALAERIQEYGAPAEAAALATAEQRGGRTRLVRLERAVPLVVRYDLVELDGDSVRGYPDVYRLRTDSLDDVAARMLADSAGVSRPAADSLVAELLRLARDSAAALPARGR